MKPVVHHVGPDLGCEVQHLQQVEPSMQHDTAGSSGGGQQAPVSSAEAPAQPPAAAPAGQAPLLWPAPWGRAWVEQPVQLRSPLHSQLCGIRGAVTWLVWVRALEGKWAYVVGCLLSMCRSAGAPGSTGHSKHRVPSKAEAEAGPEVPGGSWVEPGTRLKASWISAAVRPLPSRKERLADGAESLTCAIRALSHLETYVIALLVLLVDLTVTKAGTVVATGRCHRAYHMTRGPTCSIC